jgi:hypothetical protein
MKLYQKIRAFWDDFKHIGVSQWPVEQQIRQK